MACVTPSAGQGKAACTSKSRGVPSSVTATYLESYSQAEPLRGEKVCMLWVWGGGGVEV